MLHTKKKINSRKYTYDLPNLFSGQNVVPKKMFIEFAIHKTSHAIEVFFICFPKTRTWEIISKFDLNLMD